MEAGDKMHLRHLGGDSWCYECHTFWCVPKPVWHSGRSRADSEKLFNCFDHKWTKMGRSLGSSISRVMERKWKMQNRFYTCTCIILGIWLDNPIIQLFNYSTWGFTLIVFLLGNRPVTLWKIKWFVGRPLIWNGCREWAIENYYKLNHHERQFTWEGVRLHPMVIHLHKRESKPQIEDYKRFNHLASVRITA